jgi:hypothetical protein
MVTVVMTEKRPVKQEQDDGRRSARSASSRTEGGARTAGSPQPNPPEQPSTPDPLGASDRFRRISLSAYLKAEQRGFEPGHMWEDWLAAEREVDAERAAAPPAATSGSSH